MKYEMPESAGTIWVDMDTPNQYVAFRHDFAVPAECVSARLLLAADTNYVVWYNGSELGRGQYSDFPDRKSFTVWELPVRPGERDTIAVLAFHAGEDFFTGMNTPAGLMAAVVSDAGKILTGSGPEWQARIHTGYPSKVLPRRTLQSCFTSAFDARNFPGDWYRPEYDASAWPRAVLHCDRWQCRYERPVPACVAEAPQWGIPVRSGHCRYRTADPGASFARQMAEAEYDTGADIYGIWDLGREETGFIVFEVEAPAGTVIDYAHGEHLLDGIVRMYIGERNFADRYICHEGMNRHELYFHRVGARYLQLNIRPPSGGGAVRVRRVGLRSWSYPLDAAAPFVSDDRKALALRDMAAHTMRLCLHEHFEDCPWREQALFAYDARNQALFGYYLWGNYAFAAASFQLLAQSFAWRDDHLMMMCAPMRFERTIPVFSYVWVRAAWENYWYSGNAGLWRENSGMIAEIVEHALSRRDPATGLYHTGSAPQQWNYYEWSPGLDADGCAPDEYHAGFHFYLLDLLEHCASGDLDGRARHYQALAEELRAGINRYFWDEKRQAYASTRKGGGFGTDYHEHMQFLALLTRTAREERADQLFRSIESGALHFATFCIHPYMLDALMPHSPEARSYAARCVRESYGAMLDAGTSAFWEHRDGADAYCGAGSLCHAWSSVPVYYQGAFVLGVRPLAPGFRSFEIRPYADAWTREADGEVPTPAGPIRVRWHRDGAGLALEVEHPEGQKCHIASYSECPVLRSTIRTKK